MKATIYIPDKKASLYDEAKEKLSDSISEIFVRCLESAVENHKTSTGRIVIEMIDARTDRVSKKAFEGVWLVGDEKSGEEHQFDRQKTAIIGGGPYSVARTKKGGIAVASFNRDSQIYEFEVYSDFEEFSNAANDHYPRYPESLIAAVASELGEEHIEELDI